MGVVAILAIVAVLATVSSLRPTPARAIEEVVEPLQPVIDAALEFVTADSLDSFGVDTPLLGTIVDPVLANGDAGLYSPYKQPVTYDPTIASTASIEYTFALVVNPTSMPVTLPYPTDHSMGFADGQISLDDPTDRLAPLFPDGDGMTFDEFTTFFVEGMGLDPANSTVLTDGQEVHVVPSEAPVPRPLGDNPVYILGARTESPRTFGCPGLYRDSGVFFDTSLTDWDDTTGANSALYNDFFFAGDSAIVTNCANGPDTTAQVLRVFQGPGANPPFQDDHASGILISGPHGWIQIVNGADVPGATSVRWFDFITDEMAPYDPNYTVASATPADLMTLYPLGSVTSLFYDESLAVPDTTTTTSSSTTTVAAAPPSSAAPTTTLEATATPTTTGGGFPFPLLIFVGLALIAIGAYLWWRSWTSTVVATASGTAVVGTVPSVATVTESPPMDSGGAGILVGSPVGVRPGKGTGTGDGAPPLVGLRGWKL